MMIAAALLVFLKAGDLPEVLTEPEQPSHIVRPLVIENADIVHRRISIHPRRLQVLDAMGRPASGATTWFVSKSDAATTQCDKEGETEIPEMGASWTHVMAAMPNHAPRVFPREQLRISSELFILEFPPPSFLAALECRNPRQEAVDLRVEHPFVVNDSWPEQLKHAYRVPQEVRLEPMSDSIVFYCGDESVSTTLACHGALLMVTPNGLSRRWVFPPSSLDARLRLEPAPRLSVLPVSADPGDVSRALSVEMVFRSKKSGTTLPLKGTTSVGAYFVRPFEPEYDDVLVSIRSVPPGICQAIVAVELSGRDEMVELELTRGDADIQVVDARGQPIAGATVVQGNTRLAVSNTDGRVRFERNPAAGELAFLARGHDIVIVPGSVVASTERLVMPPATGVAFDPGPMQDTDLTGVGVIVEGVEVPSIVLQASSLVQRVYGVTVHSAESESFVAFRWPQESAGSTRRSVAGVYHLPGAGRRQVILLDRFGVEAARVEAELTPGAIADVTISMNGALREISGVITCAESGEPIVKARVAAGGFLDGVKVASGGKFSFVASVKTATLSASAPGYVDWSGLVQPGAGPMTVRMEPGRNLMVQVLDIKGMRVDAAVKLRDGEREWLGVRRSQGVFEFRGVPKAALIAHVSVIHISRDQKVEAGLTSVTLISPE